MPHYKVDDFLSWTIEKWTTLFHFRKSFIFLEYVPRMMISQTEDNHFGDNLFRQFPISEM